MSLHIHGLTEPIAMVLDLIDELCEKYPIDKDRIYLTGVSQGGCGACDLIAAIRTAGGEPRYTEYKGVGHASWTPTTRTDEVLDWLFEQKKQE